MVYFIIYSFLNFARFCSIAGVQVKAIVWNAYTIAGGQVKANVWIAYTIAGGRFKAIVCNAYIIAGGNDEEKIYRGCNDRQYSYRSSGTTLPYHL